MIKVKICGITNLDDAIKAVMYGADAIGFIFYEKSPRAVSPEQAGHIIKHIPPFVTTVGVFVNEDYIKIRSIVDSIGLDMIQLHGDENEELCKLWQRVIKAFRIRDFMDLGLLNRYKASAFLLDAYTPESFGGTGRLFNWDIAKDAKEFGNIILAGGLNPENVEEAVKVVMPYGVDASSGIEKSKGRKDHKKMKDFIKRAKGIE